MSTFMPVTLLRDARQETAQKSVKGMCTAISTHRYRSSVFSLLSGKVDSMSMSIMVILMMPGHGGIDPKILLMFIIRVEVFLIGKQIYIPEDLDVIDSEYGRRTRGGHCVASRYAACRAYACLRNDIKMEMQDSSTLYLNTSGRCTRLLLSSQSITVCYAVCH
jgi:hypothetical protein